MHIKLTHLHTQLHTQYFLINKQKYIESISEEETQKKKENFFFSYFNKCERIYVYTSLNYYLDE